MPGLSLNDTFNEPFYTGSPVSTLVPSVFPVAIGGHVYMTDARRHSFRTLPATSEQFDQSSEPGEASLSREGFWRRSASRFDLGAGQEFFDEEGASRRRFWASKGVNPWGGRSLCLLNGTEQKGGVTSAAVKVLSVGGYLYVADGSDLRFTNDPTGTSPTWTTIAAGGTIADIATDGANVYIAISGSTIQKAAVGDSVLTPYASATAQPDVLAFANGRLLAGDANVLMEVDADGVEQPIHTDPRATATWVAIAGTPGAVFAALNSGERGEIYSATIDDVGATIDTPALAAELPAGETVNDLTYYGGVLLIGTNKGMRAARVDGTRLDLGERIGIAKDDGGVRCFAAEAEFAWFGWTNYDAVSTGVGRANLATNISEATFVPAYASDVMAGTAGSGVQGDVLSVARHDGRTYFVVSGVGLYGETAELVESGTWNSGWIRFGVLERKMFSGMRLGFDPLEGEVGAALEFDDGTIRELGTASTAGLTVSDLPNASRRAVAVRVILTLTRGTTTTGPCVRFWQLHALPTPSRVDEFIVPIVLKTRVTDLNGRDHTFDPLAEVEFLRGLRHTGQWVTYQEGGASYTVRVDNVAAGEGDLEGWQDTRIRGARPDRFWFRGGVVTVRLLTKEEA